MKAWILSKNQCFSMIPSRSPQSMMIQYLKNSWELTIPSSPQYWRFTLHHWPPLPSRRHHSSPDPQGIRTFTTKTGSITTDSIVHLKVDFPDLAPGRHFKVRFSIDNTFCPHTSFAAILGCHMLWQLCHMLWQLQNQFDFSTVPPNIKLDDFSIPMKPCDHTELQVMETTNVQAEQDFNCHLEISLLLITMLTPKPSFHLVFGTWATKCPSPTLAIIYQSLHWQPNCLPGEPVTCHLKPDARPYHGKAFPVPKWQYKMLHDEVNRLCRLDVLKNDSPWAAPSFSGPNTNGQIHFVSNFCHLNKLLNTILSPCHLSLNSSILLMGSLFVQLLISTWDIRPSVSHLKGNNSAASSSHGASFYISDFLLVSQPSQISTKKNCLHQFNHSPAVLSTWMIFVCLLLDLLTLI
jgi:hypothetical protein